MPYIEYLGKILVRQIPGVATLKIHTQGFTGGENPWAFSRYWPLNFDDFPSGAGKKKKKTFFGIKKKAGIYGRCRIIYSEFV